MKTSKISIKPPCPELRGSLAGMKYPAFVEVKKDGEFEFVHIEKWNTFTVNKEGKVRQDFNYLDAIELKVYKSGHASATFLAELTVQEGKAGELYTLLSNKENNELKLTIFDILELDKQDLRHLELIDRREIMAGVLGSDENKTNDVIVVMNEKEAMTYFEIVKRRGFEGVVVKPLTGKLVLDVCDWVKIKSKDRNDLEVYKVDMTQERIEILHPFTDSNGLTVHINVGCKCPNKYKPFIKKGDTVTIEHQGVLASGSLRHPVLIPNPNWR